MPSLVGSPVGCGLRCHQSHQDGRHLFSSVWNARKQERCRLAEIHPNEILEFERVRGGCGEKWDLRGVVENDPPQLPVTKIDR